MSFFYNMKIMMIKYIALLKKHLWRVVMLLGEELIGSHQLL